MPTAWKCLLPMLREFLPPVMQRTVGNTQITGNLRLRLPRSLHQLHRFLFELFRKSALFFWHDALLSDALFQIYILQESPSSPLLFGQPIGLLVGLLDGLLTALLTGLLGGLRDHQSNEVIRWEWTRVQKHVFFLPLAGLLVGLLGWLIFGLLFGLVAGLFSGLLAALAVGFFPGQRDPYELSALDYYMERSRDNDIRFGLRTGLFTGLPMGLFAGLLVTLLVVLLIWLLFGLGAILHQQKLLIFLRCLGAIPRNYVQFLDYAAERILMRKVGRGYIFIHRLLLEYFGSLNPLTGAPQGAEHRQPLVP